MCVPKCVQARSARRIDLAVEQQQGQQHGQQGRQLGWPAG